MELNFCFFFLLKKKNHTYPMIPHTFLPSSLCFLYKRRPKKKMKAKKFSQIIIIIYEVFPMFFRWLVYFDSFPSMVFLLAKLGSILRVFCLWCCGYFAIFGGYFENEFSNTFEMRHVIYLFFGPITSFLRHRLTNYESPFKIMCIKKCGKIRWEIPTNHGLFGPRV